ncbi:SWIB/MDM2 domain Plus-3 GYF [Euphorbia peplus]|nr:SWIB/MDM2 domain Plus-3 GYF [Euphorbia peplus]
MGRKKNKINKEEICEGCCFECKDGGSLRICDYMDCLKAYHPTCVGKNDSFLESEDLWTCRWHFCFLCKGTPKFSCFSCPKSVCGSCISTSVFSVIGRKGGLCTHCLTLAGFIEGVKNPVSPQEEIDFNDLDTYESLFKEYWEMVKEKKGLASIHVRDAIERPNIGTISEDLCDSSADEESSQVEDEESSQVEDEDQLKSSYGGSKRHRQLSKCKKNERNISARRRKGNSKKMEFNGWASNLLLDFLHSVGKDKAGKLSQHDVSAIVIEYCNEKKLFDTVNKKKILCNAMLKSLLGKKFVKKNSIHNLLTPHFAENVELSENEQEQSENAHEHDSENENESASISFKKKRSSNSNMKPHKNETINLDVHFASVVTENIRRLYLNRSLIEELSEKPDTFDDKVIGSFVRIKSDPYDYLQKNSHMLVKVTGIKRTSRNDEVSKDVLLQVSCMPPKDISIRLLSDDNFSEEECEDLRQRQKDGRFERLSVAEFEEKARSLHEVVTKQWIPKELYRLQKLIDQANEKGWRRQLHEYVERKQLLERPSEQSRLLHEFPEIITDETEVEPTEKQYSRNDLHEFPEIITDETEVEPTDKQYSRKDLHEFPEIITDETEVEPAEKQYSRKDLLPESDSGELSKPSPKDSKEHEQKYHTVSSHESNDGGIDQAVINEPVLIQEKENCPEASHRELVSGLKASRSNSALLKKLKSNGSEPISEMIEVSDDNDDDGEQVYIIGESKKTIDDPNSCIWYCMSPKCIKEGPYSMTLLEAWSDAYPNEMTFKVWKANQSPKEAIFLTDAIRQFSRGK